MRTSLLILTISLLASFYSFSQADMKESQAGMKEINSKFLKLSTFKQYYGTIIQTPKTYSFEAKIGSFQKSQLCKIKSSGETAELYIFSSESKLLSFLKTNGIFNTGRMPGSSCVDCGSYNWCSCGKGVHKVFCIE